MAFHWNATLGAQIFQQKQNHEQSDTFYGLVEECLLRVEPALSEPVH